MIRVLIGCETSGRVRDAFLARGFDAWSCDVLPSDAPGPHLQCDVLDVLHDGWDAFIVHPSCTYLCSSGLHWNKRRPERAALTEDALTFVARLLNAPIRFIALENPVGCISSRIRKPDQIIQPHWFGDDASKATCLWLKELPRLVPTLHVAPRIVNGRPRWSNQTDSGQNRLGPSPDRWKLRSATYPGISNAFAEQWGAHILNTLRGDTQWHALHALNLRSTATMQRSATAHSNAVKKSPASCKPPSTI